MINRDLKACQAAQPSRGDLPRLFLDDDELAGTYKKKGRNLKGQKLCLCLYFYSYLRESTGLAVAALIAWKLTDRKAMTSAAAMAAAKVNRSRPVR